MSQFPKLAPHDADLVEADAQAAYEHMRATHRPHLAPWATASAEFKQVFRAHVANPYR